MSVYLEFPSIEDYPVFVPAEQLPAILPDWIKSFMVCSSLSDATDDDDQEISSSR
jgi:hypothetical protein